MLIHKMQQFIFCIFNLTLSGTGQGIFIPLSLLDQNLSAESFSKIPNPFGGENRIILTPCPAN